MPSLVGRNKKNTFKEIKEKLIKKTSWTKGKTPIEGWQGNFD